LRHSQLSQLLTNIHVFDWEMLFPYWDVASAKEEVLLATMPGYLGDISL
jgi:hypothetical protein